MVRNALFSFVLASALAGCGVADSDLSVNTGEGDEELSELSSELSADAAASWFPMSAGDEWVLASASGTRTLSVSAASGSMRYLGGLRPQGGQWLSFSAGSPNTLFAYAPGSATWGPFIRFGYQVTPWNYAPSSGACDRFKARRSATNVTVTTPAGTFQKARSIAFELQAPPNVRCAAPVFRELTFVSGVGPVAMVSGSGETFLLKSAKVGSRRLPAGVQASVKSDKSQYLSQANTIVCVRAPCPGNEVTAKAKFTFTVTNGSASSKTFQFTSGRQFDFEILDAGGKVVRAYGDDRFYTQALSKLTLAAGQSRTFTGEVELKDRTGLQLDGSYTVRALLTTAQGPSATAAFAVTVQ